MKLSDGEKLILTMLSDIYEHLGIEGFDPKLIRDAINDGQAWAIKWKYRGIFDIDETESDVHHDTVDILGMWDLIERAYGNLNSADKQRIETEAAPFGKNVEFMGFDGRDETDHLSVARFLIGIPLCRLRFLLCLKQVAELANGAGNLRCWCTAKT